MAGRTPKEGEKQGTPSSDIVGIDHRSDEASSQGQLL